MPLKKAEPMNDLSSLPYRMGVGIMLLNAHNKVFVAKRIDNQFEAWQMPQGGIDAGEDAQTAVLRELNEETGLPPDAVEILAQTPHMLRYRLPDSLIPKVWGGKFQGQDQIWFLLRLVGAESLINIATEHAEFSEWRWAEPSELPTLIVPFKRELYEEILRVFADKLA